jgi:opacity protein-like surface antigen
MGFLLAATLAAGILLVVVLAAVAGPDYSRPVTWGPSPGWYEEVSAGQHTPGAD